MSLKLALFFSVFTFVLHYSANAFNVTLILNQYSDFSNFNNYLSQTGLASQINSRQTITLLAVDNGAVSSLSGKSNDEIKNILSVHVVLDYYDVKKLQNLPNKTNILTTLFQSSGMASGQQGFLNVTVNNGNIAFGSAVKGSQLGANLVKSVASQPYNISVLQVSSVIIPTGVDGSKQNSSSSPPPPSQKQNSSSSSPPMESSPPAPSPRKGKFSPPPATTAPASSESPMSSPPMPEGPTSDAPGADAPESDKDSSGATGLRVSVGIAMLMVSWTFF